jgi:hypothetical protein
MALGAAIAGLAGGYAKGVQIKSDLEDAKENRGLKALQRQQAELELDRNKQLAQVRGQMSEAIRGFQGADLNDTQAWDAQANALEGLFVQEASLAGLSTYDALKNFRELRNNNFSEQVFAAAQFIERGDPAGIEMLKPIKNRFMPDGNMLMGGVYNKTDDTWDLRYQDKEGNDRIISMPRAELSRSLPLYMNIGDAGKLMMQRQLKEDDQNFQTGMLGKKQEFEGVQTDKKLGVKVGIAAADRASQERIAGARTTTSTQDREIARDDAALRNFDSGLEGALGYDPKYPTEKGRQRFEQDAVPATNIFRATNTVDRTRLTANESVSVLKALRDGSARVERIPGNDGFLRVFAGTTKAVIPAGMIRVEE